MTIARFAQRWLRAAALAAGFAVACALPVAAEGFTGAGAVAGVVRLDTVVQSAIGQGASPGAAVAIGHSSGDVVIRTYGRIDWSKSAPAVTDSTLYDLASLTKVLAATPAAMLLVQRGSLDLDAPISRYLPYWPRDGAKGRITARDLLLHRAGFSAGEVLPGDDRGARMRSIAAHPLEYVPGTRTVYSDISMVVLTAVVEQITGERLDQFVTRNLYMPLAMRDTRFTPLHPLDSDPFDLGRIAPTERVGDRHIQGFPQDPTARALGGISGNAGLFSSIRDVARFAQLMLVGAQGMHTPVIADSTIQLFARRQPGAQRYLGWDAPGTGPKDLWAPYFSDASFGHTGYTGTSIWIDPEHDVFVVLLTNRVDPTAANTKHMALRRAVNALVQDDFSGTPPERGTLATLTASLLHGLPFHSGDAAVAAAGESAWFGPAEESVLDGHITAALALLLLVLLVGGAAAAQPRVERRARALVAAVRRRSAR